MSTKNQTNWKMILAVIVLVLLAYILWDAYITEDPLTRVAQQVDGAIDKSTGAVVNAAGVVAGTTVDVAGAVYGATSGAVSGVVTGTGRVLVGAVNAVGDTLIYTGEAIRFDQNGKAKLVDQEGNETELSPEEAEDILAENDAVQQEQVRAATEAGVLPSPMEGEMNQDVDNVLPAEAEEESQLMDVSENGDEIPPAQPVDNPAVAMSVPPARTAGAPPQEPVLDENGNVMEGFYYYYDYPRYCTHCGGKGRSSCNNCENCGFCITPDGTGECVSGDANGPYFREDCIAYEHSANGYRVYKNSPYRYLVGLPYWRRDAYYYDLRGYPRTRYVRRTGSHLGDRRSRSAARRAAARAASRTGSYDLVVPKGNQGAFRVGRLSGSRGPSVSTARAVRVGRRGGAGSKGRR